MAQRTFQASVTANPRGLAAAIKPLVNRQVSQRLRRAGEESFERCNALTQEFEERYDDRRRYPGAPHLANSITIRYTGLDQVAGGHLEFRAVSNAPSFLFLEFGTPRHDIPPSPGGRLGWPGVLLPPGYVVDHPGSTKWKGQWRRVVARTVRDRFPGISIPRF